MMIGLILTLLLAGCESQLYTGLQEREGNDMLAMLLQNGISAKKEINKDREVTLFVPQDDVARAINLLRSNGLPRDKFSSVGEIFPKEGLISSPIEEKARYMYSMSQELSATLSMIDGVITARVHVVLPRESNGLDEPHPSSASVFIKYSSDLTLTGFVAKVKTLIANSIEGLALDKITVTLFPSDKISLDDLNFSDELEDFLGLKLTADSKEKLMYGLYGMAGLLVLLLMLGVFFFMKQRRKKMSMNEAALSADIN